MSEFEIYGGDTQVVATRQEITRVATQLHQVSDLLQNQIHLGAMFSNPIHFAQTLIEMETLVASINVVRNACHAAAESYFSTEAQIHHIFSPLEPVPVSWLSLGVIAITDPISLVMPAPAKATKISGSGLALGPTNLATLADRIKQVKTEKPGAIRIEEYGATGSKTFVVYLPGTQSWSPIPSKNSLDLQSEFKALAGANISVSERATQDALDKAGVRVTDKVVLVGFSQGGTIAANIASQRQSYDVAGVVTFGAPMNTVEIPKGIPVIALEHTNDIVPLLDKDSNPLTKDWVTSQNSSPWHIGENPFKPHFLNSYLLSAKELDVANDSNVTAMRERIFGDFEGEPAKVSYYSLEQK